MFVPAKEFKHFLLLTINLSSAHFANDVDVHAAGPNESYIASPNPPGTCDVAKKELATCPLSKASSVTTTRQHTWATNIYDQDVPLYYNRKE